MQAFLVIVFGDRQAVGTGGRSAAALQPFTGQRGLGRYRVRRCPEAPLSRGSAQIGRFVGAGFKPALFRQEPLARCSLGHPPTAQDCSRCKRECDLTLSRCEQHARNSHAAIGWSASVAPGRV